MREREIATIIQPCILCEGPMEIWHVWIDTMMDIERIEVEAIHHDCQPMRDLVRERWPRPYSG